MTPQTPTKGNLVRTKLNLSTENTINKFELNVLNMHKIYSNFNLLHRTRSNLTQWFISLLQVLSLKFMLPVYIRPGSFISTFFNYKITKLCITCLILGQVSSISNYSLQSPWHWMYKVLRHFLVNIVPNLQNLVSYFLFVGNWGFSDFSLDEIIEMFYRGQRNTF